MCVCVTLDGGTISLEILTLYSALYDLTKVKFLEQQVLAHTFKMCAKNERGGREDVNDGLSDVWVVHVVENNISYFLQGIEHLCSIKH